MITSIKNPRLVELRKLDQRKHRLRQNRFRVEGLQLIGMAIEARSRPGWQGKVIPHEVFYSEAFFSGPTAPRLLQKLSQAGAEAIPVDARVLNTLSDRDASQGLIATFDLAALIWSLEQLAGGEGQGSRAGDRGSEIRDRRSGTGDQKQDPDRKFPSAHSSNPPTFHPPLLLILDQLQDPGNLGTLIRTADAVGAQAVILLEPCVDPFDPKTIRSTMGSIFTVPLIRCRETATCFQHMAKQGYRLVGADAPRGTPVWQSKAFSGPVALVLGNEARGISRELDDRLEAYVSLPLLGRAESLNVAVAGAVLMYEWLRLNQGDND